MGLKQSEGGFFPLTSFLDMGPSLLLPSPLHMKDNIDFVTPFCYSQIGTDSIHAKSDMEH